MALKEVAAGGKTPRMICPKLFPALLLAVCAGTALRLPAAGAGTVPVELVVLEVPTSAPLPCRIHLQDGSGAPVKARGLPSWHDHFVSDGRAQLELAPGQYRYTIERGPAYRSLTGKLTVADAPLRVTNHLARLANLAEEGWWSGETHVHRPVADIERLMRAEDLHVAEVQTWWNDANPWARQSPPTNPIVRFDDNRFYDLMAGEDERGGGALLYFGLKEPLPIAGSQREYPSAMKFLREARQQPGVWVDIEKPFWWDTPVWLASGLVNSVGIAQNHMQRDGVLDNEAWGRARDRQRFPGPHGNGLWTQEIYYHALNCGLRVPPSAGSASGVLANPVGYNRAYVHVEGELTYEKWWQGLRAGRVFVSNGPLLRCRANGQLPGHVFQTNGPLELRLEGRLDSRDPIAAVELVRHGRAERITLPGRITVNESGWFLLRARADVTNTFRFASTGPWYVEIGASARTVRRESAQFFLDWVRERMAMLKLDDPQPRAEVMQPLREAERFWQDTVEQADLLTQFRRPTDEADLRYWLENMVRYHRFSPAEVSAAIGLTLDEGRDALARLDLKDARPAPRAAGAPLCVLPYPGGRHPRIGFLEGAVAPQRETKISVFTPWDDASYVVVDVPEAIWSNLGLTYLAHTHIPTLWDQQGIQLPRQEWNRRADGALDSKRTLPNGIAFGARITPAAAEVRMELWLRNGTAEKLTGLRVQNCVMLKAAAGFNSRTLTNHVYNSPYAAARSEGGRRWIITAWDPCDRCWGNEQVPCVHADPKFPDCLPGKTVRLRGWLSFYEGTDIAGEFQRIEQGGWRSGASSGF